MSNINISFGPSTGGVLHEVEFSTGYVYLFGLTMTQSQFLSENTCQIFSKEIYFSLVCGLLVPWPGIQPIPPLGEVWSPDHWTAREFLDNTIFFPGYPDTGHFNIILNSPLTWALISNVTIFSVCPFRRFLTSLPLPLDTRLSWLHSSLTYP